jgi:hypothetical protein
MRKNRPLTLKAFLRIFEGIEGTYEMGYSDMADLYVGLRDYLNGKCSKDINEREKIADEIRDILSE